MTEPTPYATAAAEQEQEHLTRAMQVAQAEHLFNRCVQLAAEVARLTDVNASLQAQVDAHEEAERIESTIE